MTIMLSQLPEDVNARGRDVYTHDMPSAGPTQQIVNSWTEWDPLEEVVLGRLSGGVFPTWQECMRATLPAGSYRLLKDRGGSALPAAEVQLAEEELEGLVDTLESEGVSVVRPEPIDHSIEFSTPYWKSCGGLYAAMPRDVMMVIGDTIVEAPMSWRCRHYESDAYRPLAKSYFRRGARWLPAPRPQLKDELYATAWTVGYAITEFEPVFDAADFLRFGRDIIVQRSHVTNDFGIEWLRRALGGTFRIHRVQVNDPHAMHIDATMLPLAPGKLLVNPKRFVRNDLFRDWEILKAPEPTLPLDWPMYFSTPWVSMNVLSLDESTVIVESHEEPLIEALADWGFRCISLNFRHVYSFGGSFHCVTLDVRRRGGIGTYLDVDVSV
jgi:glycine amidinotransferase